MSNPTLGQAAHILRVVEEKGTPKDQLQDLIRTGLLADLLDANVNEVNREEFRKLLGLHPLGEQAENIVGQLRLISRGQKIVLSATSGVETLANARDVFMGWVDPDFKNWGLDVVASPMPETKVSVYEMVKDGAYANIFGGFGENLDRLCFTQAQIRLFCIDHAKWLRQDGWATLFLFKVNREFFVARVRVFAHGLRVHVYRFSHGLVWHAGFRLRLVVPQLDLET